MCLCVCECCSQESRAIGDEKKIIKWKRHSRERKEVEEEIGRMIRMKKVSAPSSPAVGMMNWPISKSSEDRQRQNKVCCICRKKAAEVRHEPQDVVSLEFNYKM